MAISGGWVSHDRPRTLKIKVLQHPENQAARRHFGSSNHQEGSVRAQPSLIMVGAQPPGKTSMPPRKRLGQKGAMADPRGPKSLKVSNGSAQKGIARPTALSENPTSTSRPAETEAEGDSGGSDEDDGDDVSMFLKHVNNKLVCGQCGTEAKAAAANWGDSQKDKRHCVVPEGPVCMECKEFVADTPFSLIHILKTNPTRRQPRLCKGS